MNVALADTVTVGDCDAEAVTLALALKLVEGEKALGEYVGVALQERDGVGDGRASRTRYVN